MDPISFSAIEKERRGALLLAKQTFQGIKGPAWTKAMYDENLGVRSGIRRDSKEKLGGFNLMYFVIL